MAEAERVRQIYNKLAGSYDQSASGIGDAMRGRLLKQARGAVLELGVGTGATFGHYPATVEGLLGLDISEGMLAQARAKVTGLPFPVALQQADFQRIPCPAASFDTVVTSLALCGIPDPPLMFSEIARVLRPGGQLLSFEHVRPPMLLGWLTMAADPLWHRLIGCHLNRPTVRLLRDSGFQVAISERKLFGGLVSVAATPAPPGQPAR